MGSQQGQSKATDAAVVVVGGGPVGLGLAIDLGQRGVCVAVMERQKTLHRVPKGQNLTQRTGEHFRAWGVSKEIRKAAPIPHEFGSAGLTAFGTLLGGFTYDWLLRAEVRRYYFADNERLPQYDTERVLRQSAARLGNVRLHDGLKVKSVHNHRNTAIVEMTNVDGSDAPSMTAKFVVGCDGSNSTVRKTAGIKQDTDPHGLKMVLLVFKSVELHDLLAPFGNKSYFHAINPDLDGYWQFLGRVDLKSTWFFTRLCHPMPRRTILIGAVLDNHQWGYHGTYEKESFKQA